MSSEHSLSLIEHGNRYTICGFRVDKTEYSVKLEKLGFTPGTPVELGPSNIKNPMVVKLRGSRIALRRDEAEIVNVRTVN